MDNTMKDIKIGASSCSGLEEKWVIRDDNDDGSRRCRVVPITRSPIDWKKATSPMYTERNSLTSAQKRALGLYRVPKK